MINVGWLLVSAKISRISGLKQVLRELHQQHAEPLVQIHKCVVYVL